MHATLLGKAAEVHIARSRRQARGERDFPRREAPMFSRLHERGLALPEQMRNPPRSCKAASRFSFPLRRGARFVDA
jgi:hypothetical protein